MNARTKLSIVTAAGLLALTGTGFAAWTFNKDASVNSTANVTVLPESELGTLTITTASLYIVLDQAGIYYASDAAGANPVTRLEANYNAPADGTLGENMDIDFDLAFSGATADWATYVNGLADVSLGTVTVDHGDNALAFTLPALTYTAAKPSTESEYDAMKAALDGKTVTMTVTADAAADDVAD